MQLAWATLGKSQEARSPQIAAYFKSWTYYKLHVNSHNVAATFSTEHHAVGGISRGRH